MSCRPKMVEALAVRKARTTPEPVPTSRTRGVVVGALAVLAKRWDRKVLSEDEESVSRRRKESSDGS